MRIILMTVVLAVSAIASIPFAIAALLLGDVDDSHIPTGTFQGGAYD